MSRRAKMVLAWMPKPQSSAVPSADRLSQDILLSDKMMAKGSITSAMHHESNLSCRRASSVLSCDLSWVVSTLSKGSKTQGACSKSNGQNLKWLRLLFMCLLLFLPRVRHLCNLAVVKRTIVLSINAQIKRKSATAAYHWIEENKTNTMVKIWFQTDNYSEIIFSWVFLLEKSPEFEHIHDLPDIRGPLDCLHAKNVYAGLSVILSVNCMCSIECPLLDQ